MREKLKNIILSFWIEEWNWKPLKLLQKKARKKIEIQRMRTILKNIIFNKLILNDELKINKTSIKRPRSKCRNKKKIEVEILTTKKAKL